MDDFDGSIAGKWVDGPTATDTGRMPVEAVAGHATPVPLRQHQCLSGTTAAPGNDDLLGVATAAGSRGRQVAALLDHLTDARFELLVQEVDAARIRRLKASDPKPSASERRAQALRRASPKESLEQMSPLTKSPQPNDDDDMGSAGGIAGRWSLVPPGDSLPSLGAQTPESRLSDDASLAISGCHSSCTDSMPRLSELTQASTPGAHDLD